MKIRRVLPSGLLKLVGISIPVDVSLDFIISGHLEPAVQEKEEGHRTPSCSLLSIYPNQERKEDESAVKRQRLS
jgi:hypothetical protein